MKGWKNGRAIAVKQPAAFEELDGSEEDVERWKGRRREKRWFSSPSETSLKASGTLKNRMRSTRGSEGG